MQRLSTAPVSCLGSGRYGLPDASTSATHPVPRSRCRCEPPSFRRIYTPVPTRIQRSHHALQTVVLEPATPQQQRRDAAADLVGDPDTLGRPEGDPGATVVGCSVVP